MQIIRKLLSPNELAPNNIRWSAECDCPQVSTDGGATWVDAPGQDIRHADAYRMPARGGDDPRCNASGCMTDRLKVLLDTLITGVTIFQVAAAWIGVVLALLPGAGWLIDAILAAAEALFALGVAALDAALTESVYEQLNCIIYCNIGDDGQMSADQYETIRSQVESQIGGLAYIGINYAMSILGEVGLSNAGTQGETERVCDDCICEGCHEWSFVGDPSIDGNYTVRNFHSALTPSIVFTRISVEWQLNPNPGAILHTAHVLVHLNTGDFIIDTDITDVTGTLEWTGTLTAAQFVCEVRSWYDSGGSDYPDWLNIHFEYVFDPAIEWEGGADC